ncbi:hypothetical protein GUJ93_ZPchr0013g34222 [Zizania palustris]|uniref:MPBQ/MBSQ family SAM-binding methyltransferase profile domain-containing protein n=1 Tax=Zizania palustris TaxID=103762 RepID=A0A8J6BX04_ZIZPA|nr:hypothetical protein GUJ93_ZPchr0013g34222 [Zizania palustris]
MTPSHSAWRGEIYAPPRCLGRGLRFLQKSHPVYRYCAQVRQADPTISGELRPSPGCARSCYPGGAPFSSLEKARALGVRCAALLSSSSTAARPISQPRFIQHKKEAFWFYCFLSIVYDHVINLGHWIEDIRDDALEPTDLYSCKLKVIDVGIGTGFTTLGLIKHVNPENVTLLDQSPHQLEKARQKEALKGVTIMEGDAKDLPFPTDTFDRYVFADRCEKKTWSFRDVLRWLSGNATNNLSILAQYWQLLAQPKNLKSGDSGYSENDMVRFRDEEGHWVYDILLHST